LPRDLRELCELAQQPPEIRENSTDNDAALGSIELGHRELQISIAYTPQPAVEVIGCQSYQLPDRESYASRQQQERF
jgi:hypothetical protein